MPVETATYISELNPAYPPTTDPVSQADDHLRLIKAAIQTTFPSVAGAVTASHTLINGFDGRITAVEGGALYKTGGTLTGPINMGSQALTNLAAPVNPNDAARKTDVDTATAGLASGKTQRVFQGATDVSYAVTVSTAAPTGGNDGDVWYTY